MNRPGTSEFVLLMNKSRQGIRLSGWAWLNQSEVRSPCSICVLSNGRGKAAPVCCQTMAVCIGSVSKRVETDFQVVTADDAPQVGHNHTRDTTNELEIRETQQSGPHTCRTNENLWPRTVPPPVSPGRTSDTFLHSKGRGVTWKSQNSDINRNPHAGPTTNETRS